MCLPGGRPAATRPGGLVENSMQIRIVNYSATVRDAVQAFVDIELNGWLRLNGVHFQRDGTLRPAQLTPLRNGQRLFIPAVEVLDADLRELLTADILAAIHQHLETLPPEKRARPTRPREQPVRAEQPAKDLKTPQTGTGARLVLAKPVLEKPKLPLLAGFQKNTSAPEKPRVLPPPNRLLVQAKSSLYQKPRRNDATPALKPKGDWQA